MRAILTLHRAMVVLATRCAMSLLLDMEGERDAQVGVDGGGSEVVRRLGNAPVAQAA